MWPGTRESTLNQNSVSCSKLMMRTSRSAPVPSALQADEPLPPCNRGCHASAAILRQAMMEGWKIPLRHLTMLCLGLWCMVSEQADGHSSAAV